MKKIITAASTIILLSGTTMAMAINCPNVAQFNSATNNLNSNYFISAPGGGPNDYSINYIGGITINGKKWALIGNVDSPDVKGDSRNAIKIFEQRIAAVNNQVPGKPSDRLCYYQASNFINNAGDNWIGILPR